MIGAPTYCINGIPSNMIYSPSRSIFKFPSWSRRAMVVAMSSATAGQSYWATTNAEVDAHLKQAIPIRPPLSVFEPMQHLTLSTPQTTAPALCIAACELVGGSRGDAMAAASSLRLMHAAAYVHEQLPLTDRPRPKHRPITDHQFGPNVELMTGDGMLPLGMELLAESVDPAQNNSDRILRVIIEITRAGGSQGIVQGQYNELDYEDQSQMELVKQICKKKEGGLHACAGACGAILGGGSEEEIERLRKYGLYVGMVQGLSKLVGRKEWAIKEINELRNLALQELKDFDQGKVEAISSFCGDQVVQFSNA